LLDRAEESLRSLPNHVPGVLIERKKFSIAVHYRQVEGDRVAAVAEAVDREIQKHDGLRKGKGKKVFELQPEIDWNKGKALCWLMDALELAPLEFLPFYIGDDVTDEDAFRVLQDFGIGVVVKDDPSDGAARRSAARYTLDDCPQVRQFLEKLTGMIPENDQ
jgi:trehalose-phosphatase